MSLRWGARALASISLLLLCAVVGGTLFPGELFPAAMARAQRIELAAAKATSEERLCDARDGKPAEEVTEAPGSSAAVIRLAERADGPADSGLAIDLPATYGGDLPCADCDRLRYRLNLWPDHVFNLRRSWLPTNRAQDALGRWWIDTAVNRLVLWDGEDKMEFAIGPARLRLIDRDNLPATKPEGYELTGTPGTTPMAVRVPVRGMVSFLADHAQITECLTGRVYPFSPNGEFPTLEAAYLAAGVAQGTPLMASFQGRVLEAGDGDDGDKGPLVVVNRFTGVWPEETCEQAMSSRSLTNTYWRVVRLGKTEISAAEQAPEPHLVLKEGENRFVATVGCNQLFGGFERDGDKLIFKNPAATMMACPPPLDDWERMLTGALASTRGWRVNGEALELLDSAGMQIALFQAEEMP